MRPGLLLVASAIGVGLALTGCTAAPGTPAGQGRPSTSAPAPATATPLRTGPTSTVAVLGDSLSRGYNACSHYGDCPAVSWAGGTDPRVDSVATRLGARTGGRVVVRNLARSGATVADLERQATLAAEAAPTLATVLIGANDVCRASVDDMTPTADYAAAVGAALQRLSVTSPTTVILVATVPDVPALLTTAAANPTARFLWANNGGGCATVLADPQSTSSEAVDRRAAVEARIADYDAAVARICTGLPRCIDDGGALNDYRPALGQVSALDYFHPSIRGLTELARLQWRALTASSRSAPLFDR